MATRPDAPQPAVKKTVAPSIGGKKDFTTDYPMVDLEECLRLAMQIHDKGLETASMLDVAKGCGYSNATSTPFYKKMLAARMFKILVPQKATLSQLAMDYFKPNQEDGRAKALMQAVHAVPAYDEILQKSLGRKLNLEIIANGFARTASLSDSCAALCARVFLSSVKFAGLLAADGTVSAGKTEAAPDEAPLSNPPLRDPLPPAAPPSNNEGSQAYTLILDSTRKVVVTAPPTVSKRELARINKWLEFQLIITEEEASQSPQ